MALSILCHMTIFVALLLPETRNVRIEEMNKVWKLR